MPEWLTQPGALVIIAALAAGIGAIVKVSRWGGRVDSRLETLETTTKEVRSDIKAILRRLPPATVEGASPLRLTELGQEISAKLDGAAWAREVAPKVLKRVRGMDPYRVQEFCRSYVQDGTDEGWAPDEEMATQLGRCASEHGLKLEQVLDVLAIELRDCILAETAPELIPAPRAR